MASSIEIPEKTAFHCRFATMEDMHSIIAAERNYDGDKVLMNLMHRRSREGRDGDTAYFPAVDYPQIAEEERLKQEEQEKREEEKKRSILGDRVISREEDFVYTHMIDPSYQYMVIGYFREPALRPRPSEDEEIPQIDVPPAEVIKSGKEHIVGFAMWHHAKGRSPEQWDKAENKAKRSRNPAVDARLAEATAGPRWQQRRLILKDHDYWSLSELFIDARFQRQGLGSRLVKWGVEEGNKRGLPIYIEATQKGLGLYLKYGLREVYRVDTDLSKYGGEAGQWHRYTLLYRDAMTSG